MKKSLIITIAVLIFMSATVSFAQDSGSNGSKVISELQYPDLIWSVPEVGKDVKRVVLDNGMLL